MITKEQADKINEMAANRRFTHGQLACSNCEMKPFRRPYLNKTEGKWIWNCEGCGTGNKVLAQYDEETRVGK